MKVVNAGFEELPVRRGWYRLALKIRGMATPVYWRVGDSIHPCAVVTAMVHGDEFEGFVAAMDVWEWARSTNLAGSLMVLPVCNPAASAEATRHTPLRHDGLNLARTFPGSARGSYTERLANAIWRLVRRADVLIDLHSGGVGYDYARLAGYYREQDARLCALFPKAFLWPAPPTRGVLSYEFSKLKNKVSLGWECGGEARIDRAGARTYATAVRRVLVRTDVVIQGKSDRDEQIAAPQRIARTRTQTARGAGWFLPRTTVGSHIQQGQVIGDWISPDLGRREVKSRHEGTVIALRTLPRVQRGDYLALVAKLC